MKGTCLILSLVELCNRRINNWFGWLSFCYSDRSSLCL